jgi:hypothetical protein
MIHAANMSAVITHVVLHSLLTAYGYDEGSII